MEPNSPNSVSPTLRGHAFGSLSNDGQQRYLIEAESSTGFVAWQMADGTILVNPTQEVSLPRAQSITFWPCAGYMDTTPAGRITYFDCHGNALTRLDVRGLAGLEYLDCSFNLLTQLPLDDLTELQALDADNNRLTSLAVRGSRALRVLNCSNNRLNELDVSGLDQLEILGCANNPLGSLRHTGCHALKDLDVNAEHTH